MYFVCNCVFLSVPLCVQLGVYLCVSLCLVCVSMLVSLYFSS